MGTTVLGRMALSANISKLKQYKAAIIGRTGGGDYGHGFDTVFQNLDHVTVAAVADANPEGLKKAAERSQALRQYSDYREMLEKEKPDLVSIGPRHPDCHKDMALAAIAVGAHIYMEKPMTESVDVADEILAAAKKQGVKIGIGHTRRFMTEFRKIKELIGEGTIGTVLDVRVQGKQDSRVGGEDLIVLGTHDFDIMRWCFGDPLWCFAGVTQNGKDISRDHVRKGREPIWVAGDTVRAMFAFPENIQCYWNSVKTDDHWNTNFSDQAKWQIEFHGTKQIIVWQEGLDTAIWPSPFSARKHDDIKWKELPQPEKWEIPDYEKHPILNLIHAIETDTQPLCSGHDGRWTIEMVSAVYQSHKSRQRIHFPLDNRTNPLLDY